VIGWLRRKKKEDGMTNTNPDLINKLAVQYQQWMQQQEAIANLSPASPPPGHFAGAFRLPAGAQPHTTDPEPEGNPPTQIGLQGWRRMSIISLYPLILRGSSGGHLTSAESVPAACNSNWKHEVPAWDCTCGYYALNTPPEGSSACLIKISAAGRTIITEQGFITHRYRVDEVWLGQKNVQLMLDLAEIEEVEERFGAPIYLMEGMVPYGSRAKEVSRDRGAPGDAEPEPTAGAGSPYYFSRGAVTLAGTSSGTDDVMVVKGDDLFRLHP
jgi:hypothetical protein